MAEAFTLSKPPTAGDGDAVALFQRHARRLRGLAYRMLGELDAAEDVVQEAWLRFAAADRAALASPEAWLVTVTTRLAIDRLRAARLERTAYVGPWLPEPLATDGGAAAERIELSSDLSIALLVVLESLDPVERAAFLLHEAFDFSHGEIARIVGRSEVATRQIVRRARAHVAQRRPRFAVDDEARRRLLLRFVEAARAGDVAGLQDLLAADAVLWSDGGGKAKAALNPILGASRVARLMDGLARKMGEGVEFRPCQLNGTPGIVGLAAGRPFFAFGIDVAPAGTEAAHDVVRSVFIVMNPDKLGGLAHAGPGGGEAATP